MSMPIVSRRFFWLSLLLGFSALNSSAQDPYFDHYSEDVELPTNQIYGMVQDHDNILYFNTDRGVVRFDGYQFLTITQKQGLEDNCILRMKKDRFNRIWMTSISNTCNYLENGIIETAPFNNQLKSIRNHEHYVQNVYFPTPDTGYITFDYPGLFKVVADTLEEITSHHNQVEGASVCIIKTEDEYYWDQWTVPATNPDSKSAIKVLDNKIFITTYARPGNLHKRKELCRIGANEFFFSFENRLLHIKNDSLIYEKIFTETILSIYYDPVEHDLWVGIDNQGAFRFPSCDLRQSGTNYLPGRGITGILRDHEKNYWFTVRDDGIYRANNLDFQTFSLIISNLNDNRITALCSFGSKLFIGTYSGKLFEMHTNATGQYAIYPVKNFANTGGIRKIQKTSSNTLLVFSSQLTEIDSLGNKKGFKDLKTYPYEFAEIDSVYSILSITAGIRLIKNRKYDVLYDAKGYRKVRHIFKDSKNTFWFSSQPDGIFLWKPFGQPFRPDSMGGFEENRSLGFAEIDSSMVISTISDGILIYKNGLRAHFNSFNSKLKSDILDAFLLDGDFLWTASSEGLNRIQFNPELTEITEIDNFNTRNGLPSNKVNCLAHFDDHIWAGTGRGLVKIRPNQPPTDHLARPRLEGFYYNSDSIADLKAPMILPNKHPYNIKIRFKTISYYKPHRIYYHYKLDGIDNQWNSTPNLEIGYQDLKAGVYTIQIFASDKENISASDFPNSEHILTHVLTIPKKFTDKTIFKLLLILAILLLAGLILILIISSLKTREQSKHRLLQAEKTALLAQMNPHFIFNSLNSIQHYIIQQDADNANMYLAKFSQLIRKILDNSKKRQISLGEEIEALMLYLNLEKLRFEDNFEFELTKSKSLDQNEIMIPPMLIQPFVENAIWHGLMPLREKGLLQIHFDRLQEKMLVTVSDNGVGRAKSAEKKRITGHTPTGLKNVNERLTLLNKAEDLKISCQITDLMKPDGSAGGTRVELSIPIQQKDEKRKP